MGFRHFTKYDRIRLESWLRAGMSVKFIAGELGKSPSSIYREIKRGAYEHTLYDLTTEIRYSSDLADARYREHLKAKGPGLKIGSDRVLAEYIEYKIHEEHYSPGAVLGEIKSLGLEFDTSISKTTLYRYIDEGLFLTVTNSDLPVKRNKNRHRHKKVRCCSAPAGCSIEQRPDAVHARNTFGHWEMDCVVGKRGTRKTLLVLTERLTRNELVYLMPDRTASSVVSCINSIEEHMGSTVFSRVFRSITVDNGSEFRDVTGIEFSPSGRKRTSLYFCHPYSSWERGSNENQNKLIRRHFPKGFDFTHVTKAAVARVQNWINNYPRKMFGWRSSGEMFRLHMDVIMSGI